MNLPRTLRDRLGATSRERAVAVVAIVAVVVGMTVRLLNLSNGIYMAAWVIAVVCIVTWNVLVRVRLRRDRADSSAP